MRNIAFIILLACILVSPVLAQDNGALHPTDGDALSVSLAFFGAYQGVPLVLLAVTLVGGIVTAVWLRRQRK
jgi:hypothetical protein